MTKTKLEGALRLVFVSVVLVMLAACSQPDDDDGEDEPSRVTVETVTVRADDVAIWRNYPGRVLGLREVEARARVTGVLQTRHYHEGDYVEQGDALFQIDPRPFEAALASARAERANAQARFNQRERDWQRTEPLYESGNISQRERDDALSAFEFAQAELDNANANVEQAQIDLGFAQIEAPISGFTELEAVAEGNLIQSGDLLTRVVQQDQLQIRFSISEQDARTRRGLDDDSRALAYVVADYRGARQRDEDDVVVARIDFNQRSVNRDTASVQLRALVDNDEDALSPGEFVRIELIVDYLSDALLVPETAVSEGERGPYVYVVEDDKAEQRLVELGATLADGIVIRQGLSAGDEVVVAGQSDLTDGADVEVAKRDGEATD